MYKCHFQKKLSAYLDDQLDAQQKLAVSNHLKGCKFCAEELTRLEALAAKLKTWQVPPIKPEFDAAVTDKIVSWELGKGDVKMKRKTWAILIPSGVLAGIFVFLFVGMFAHMQGQFEVSKRVLQGRARGSGFKSEVSQGREVESPSYISQDASMVQAAALESSGNDQYKPFYSTDVLQGTLGFDSASGKTDIDASSARVMRQAFQSPASSPSENYLAKEEQGQGTVIVIQPGLPATGQGEKIIRTGDITIEVENGKETYKKVSDLCQELGGFLSSSNFYRDNEGREAGTITLRIPKDKFTAALDRLSALGKVQDINTDSKDVSQEYANLTSQLDAAMVVYKKMLEALQKKQVTIPEAMRLESEITPILKRVQDLKNKIESLNNLISFTTVTAHFYETRASFKALKESSRFIRESILTAGIKAVQLLAKAIPVIIILAVVLVVFIGIAALVKNWVMRFFKRE